MSSSKIPELPPEKIFINYRLKARTRKWPRLKTVLMAISLTRPKKVKMIILLTGLKKVKMTIVLARLKMVLRSQ